jgi:hypothetical protein
MFAEKINVNTQNLNIAKSGVYLLYAQTENGKIIKK